MSLIAEPVVSVVIVNFNSGNWLSRCMQSVLASTIPVEVVVVDNASQDGSARELTAHYEKDPRVFFHFNPTNLGFARAVNMGIHRSRAPWVLLLNPDCLIAATTLEAMVLAMNERPRCGMAGCLIRNEDGTEQRGCRRRIPTALSALGRLLGARGELSFDLTASPLPDEPVTVEAISGAFMLVRRSAVEVVGPLDEGFFLHCEDLDWCLRFSQAGYDILFVPSVEIIHKQGVCSTRSPMQVEWFKHQGMARFYRKHRKGIGSLIVAPAVFLAIYLHFAFKALRLGLR